MIIRPARPEDVVELRAFLGPERDYIRLDECICFVAEVEGRIVGMLPARLVWEVEPLLVRSGKKITDSRAALGMYRAAENWLRSAANTTGVRTIYAHTFEPAVKGWAKRLGWHRIYRNMAHYLKIL